MTNKIMKLLNSPDSSDILLGLMLFIKLPNYLNFYIEHGNEGTKWADHLKYNFNWCEFTYLDCIDFVVYRDGKNFVYCPKKSEFYKRFLKPEVIDKQ